VERRRKEEKENEGCIKVAFWNTAGLGNKGKRFWRKLKKWNVTILIETWVE